MRWTAGLAVLAMTASAGGAAPTGGRHWISSWGSAQMIPDGNNALPPAQLTDATLRQSVHLSAGGDRLRVRFSNAFGTEPLLIDAATVALAPAPGSPRLAGPAAALSFSGRPWVLIPAGAEMDSDPVALSIPAGADLAISLHLPQPPARETGHPGSRTLSYTLAGNHVADADLPGAAQFERWYGIADVEVAASPAAATVVAIGDSITDGHAVGTNHEARWTDRLAERMRADPRLKGWGVVNAGIGGNRVLRDGLGPNLVARFDRDVIARPNVRVAIVLEGVNDLGVLTRDHPATPEQHAALVASMEAGFREVVARAHAHGIRVIGGTIMPLGGNDYYHPGPATEADRQALNTFIRTSGTFDDVIDFDRVTRDRAHPDRLSPAVDSGDHLHPGEAGYRLMGNAVPLPLLSKPAPSADVAPPSAGPAVAPVIGAAAPLPPVSTGTGPAIALTFDDLPAHGPLPPGETRLDVINQIIAALKAAGAPVFGFMNGGFGVDDPLSPSVLAAWRAAGFPLGNHTYPHMALSKNTAEAWDAEVVRNEPILQRYMAGQDWRWLRYPFLDEGESPAKIAAARTFLGARGYKVAAVTMSFGDYNWNEPYARCVAKGDTAAIGRLEQSYLDAARIEAGQERLLSRAATGRDIPYVLLMHVGAFDARVLPRLLAQYRAEGFRFVSLPEAERDPFYANAMDLSLPGPTPNLAAAAAAKGAQVPRTPLPTPGADVCR